MYMAQYTYTIYAYAYTVQVYTCIHTCAQSIVLSTLTLGHGFFKKKVCSK